MSVSVTPPGASERPATSCQSRARGHQGVREVYENGKVVSTKGSWEAGVDGAKPGIIIPADPKVRQSYYQEYYPSEAMDMAKVLSLDASVTVPYGSFDHALESREWTPLQPGFSEKKYYVAGVGPLGNPGDQGTDRCKAQVR
jgi:hypothetical protein